MWGPMKSQIVSKKSVLPNKNGMGGPGPRQHRIILNKTSLYFKIFQALLIPTRRFPQEGHALNQTHEKT